MPMLPEKYEKRVCQVVVKFNTVQVSWSLLQFLTYVNELFIVTW